MHTQNIIMQNIFIPVYRKSKDVDVENKKTAGKTDC